MIAEIALYALILALLIAALALIQLARRAARRAAILYVLSALALLAFAGVLLWRPPPAPILIEKSAPALDLPPLVAGQPRLTTADLKGHVTLVNFFASWCGPCRAEHPVLSGLADNGIRLVGIDYKDKPAAATAFLAEHGNPYARVAADTDGGAAIAFGASGVPESFLIDPNGFIRYQSAGPLTEQKLRDEILPLAAHLK